jgi:hypothetical protein
MDVDPFWANRDPQGLCKALIEAGRYWDARQFKGKPDIG